MGRPKSANPMVHTAVVLPSGMIEDLRCEGAKVNRSLSAEIRARLKRSLNKTATTLDFAQTAFEERPSHETAGAYMQALLAYEADDMIGDDTWLDGLSAIAAYLLNPKEPM